VLHALGLLDNRDFSCLLVTLVENGGEGSDR
jgi:hypothetical protein